jgi:peptide deformylase
MFSDDLSELLQHEIDHLYGVLATDRMISNKDIILRAEWEKRYNENPFM